MRRIVDELGIRAPSLYKHVPHKATLEVAIIIDGFEEAAAAFEPAVDGADDPLGAFVGAYRSFGLRTPARLPADDPKAFHTTSCPKVWRSCLPARGGSRKPGACPRAWAFIHGMTVLELDGRFPTDDVTEPAWRRALPPFDRVPTPRSDHARDPTRTLEARGSGVARSTDLAGGGRQRCNTHPHHGRSVAMAHRVQLCEIDSAVPSELVRFLWRHAEGGGIRSPVSRCVHLGTRQSASAESM